MSETSACEDTTFPIDDNERLTIALRQIIAAMHASAFKYCDFDFAYNDPIASFVPMSIRNARTMHITISYDD